MEPVVLIPVFALLHTIGALIGAGTTLFAEVFYTKAAADGIIDHHERKYLRHLFHGLTYGMVLVLISALALIVLEYLVPNAPQEVLTGPFWMLQLITFAVIIFAYYLSKRQVEWWLASAAILTGWWLMVVIDLGFLNSFGFLSILLFYISATLIVAGLLGYLRVLMRPKQNTI